MTTMRMARMPEPKKATVKSMLSAELSGVLDARPGLTLVKLADGAKDNWTYLHDALPEGVELVDFYHAVTHLKTAFDAAYGEHTPKARSQFEKYRHVLLEGADGVGQVIRAFVYLRDRHPRRATIATELAYFRRHRHRMRYDPAPLTRPVMAGPSWTTGSHPGSIPVRASSSDDQRRCATSNIRVPDASAASVARSPVSRSRT